MQDILKYYIEGTAVIPVLGTGVPSLVLRQLRVECGTDCYNIILKL